MVGEWQIATPHPCDRRELHYERPLTARRCLLQKNDNAVTE